MAQTYHIINYGCQMNESDAEHFAGQLEDMGYSYTPDYQRADVVLVNTCCVRESAERKILGKIGELKGAKARKPEMIICVAGCMAQKGGKELVRKYPQIDLLIGTSYVNNFRALLTAYLAQRPKHGIYSEMSLPVDEFTGSFVRRSSFAAWVPIMYGCNNFCTYCIVPYVRGRERSRASSDIVREIEQAVAQGYKEFTLLGQNVNSYGKGSSVSFAELLQQVDAISGVERIRYMTSHPRDMGEDVVRAVAASQHICPNFHLPVQSGSDRILKAMNRGYDREKYFALIDMVRSYVPEATITTDIIVGFPGETEEDFRATLDLVDRVSYDQAYTFIYSKRSGTPAAKMTQQVELAEKKRRLNELMALQNKHGLARNQLLVGSTVEVMVEGPSHSDSAMWTGRTRGNKIVLWPSEGRNFIPGECVKVRIVAAQTWLVKGQISDE